MDNNDRVGRALGWKRLRGSPGKEFFRRPGGFRVYPKGGAWERRDRAGKLMGTVRMDDPEFKTKTAAW